LSWYLLASPCEAGDPVLLAMELVANADVSKETETHSRQSDATRGILIAKAR
jgi:hypothetical protein